MDIQKNRMILYDFIVVLMKKDVRKDIPDEDLDVFVAVGYCYYWYYCEHSGCYCVPNCRLGSDCCCLDIDCYAVDSNQRNVPKRIEIIRNCLVEIDRNQCVHGIVDSLTRFSCDPWLSMRPPCWPRLLLRRLPSF